MAHDDWKDDPEYIRQQQFHRRVIAYRDQIREEPLGKFLVQDFPILHKLFVYNRFDADVTEHEFAQICRRVPEKATEPA